MKEPSILLLTKDAYLQAVLTDVLTGFQARTLYASDVTEALQLVCRNSGHLDLAVIEFAHGCHGMTLLSAVEICQPDVPIIAITANARYDAKALLCAKDLAACLTKPVRRTELKIAIEEALTTDLFLQTA